MKTTHLALLFTLLSPFTAFGERPPSGIKGSRTLEHYKQRLDSAVQAAQARLGRAFAKGTSVADRYRKESTLLKLKALRLEADSMTPEQFGKAKGQFRPLRFLTRPLPPSEIRDLGGRRREGDERYGRRQ
jgi:hypothetical protein